MKTGVKAWFRIFDLQSLYIAYMIRRFLILTGFCLHALLSVAARDVAVEFQWVHPASALACEYSDISVDTSRLENALLWKVTHPGLRSTSYLFGTIHIIAQEDYFLPAGTESALAGVERIVFEIDMKEMSDLGAMMSIMMKAFMANGIRLRDLISAEDYRLVETHFKDIGLPMFMLDRIKPMFLSVFANSEIGPDALQSGEMTSYEMEFYDYALEHNLSTGGLETIDFQISVFDSIPYAVQAEMLVESIRAGEDTDDMLLQLTAAYKAQDIEALYAMIHHETTGMGDYSDVLVGNRNARWISGIREYMKEGNMFFAVGAGHLGGAQGVIRLLRAEGFTVTPVSGQDDRQIKKF